MKAAQPAYLMCALQRKRLRHASTPQSCSRNGVRNGDSRGSLRANLLQTQRAGTTADCPMIVGDSSTLYERQ